MKKTLNEEKARILSLMEQKYPPSIQKELDENPDEKFRYDLIDYIEALQNQNKDIEQIQTHIISAVQTMIETYRADMEDEEDINANVQQDPRGFGYGYARLGDPNDIKI